MTEQNFVKEYQNLKGAIRKSGMYIVHRTKMELDDAEQELAFYLVLIYKKYDSSRGVKFSTFAIRALLNRAKTLVAQEYRCKRVNMYTRLFYDYEEQLIPDNSLTEIEKVDQKIAFKDYKREITIAIKKKGTAHALNIFNQLLTGRKLTDISNSLNLPMSWVSKIIKTQVKPVVARVISNSGVMVTI